MKSSNCLRINELSGDEIDLVSGGSIVANNYFSDAEYSETGAAETTTFRPPTLKKPKKKNSLPILP
jgi:hypothetical protein